MTGKLLKHLHLRQCMLKMLFVREMRLKWMPNEIIFFLMKLHTFQFYVEPIETFLLVFSTWLLWWLFHILDLTQPNTKQAMHVIYINFNIIFVASKTLDNYKYIKSFYFHVKKLDNCVNICNTFTLVYILPCLFEVFLSNAPVFHLHQGEWLWDCQHV